MFRFRVRSRGRHRLILLVTAAVLAAEPVVEPDRSDGDPIIVTGERSSRSLRETASSLALFTPADIDRLASPDRLDQLLETVPNIQFGTGGQGPTIRGQDSSGALQDLPAFFAGTRPRVTLQVDGRPVGYHEYVFGVAPLWDVRQVELFRSPQTTTQGRNAIAGAIFVATEDPGDDWEAAGRAIVGSARTRQMSALLSGPLIDERLSFRIAADGRTSRPSSRIADNLVGARPDRDDFALVRVKLLARPAPGLKLLATGVHSRSRMPQIEGVRAPFEERRDPLALYGLFRNRVDSLTGRAELDVAPDVEVEAIVSAGDTRTRRFAPRGLGEARIGLDDLSGEFLVRWKPAGPLDAVAGVHLLESRLDQSIDLFVFGGVARFDDVQRSLGIFGQIDWRIAERLTLSAGLRHQQDRQDRGGTIERDGRPILDLLRRDQALLPRVSLAWRAVDGITAGLLVQRAYNPGGASLNLETGGTEAFDDERLWSAEAFTRTELARGRLALSANAFVNFISNAQRAQPRFLFIPGVGGATWAQVGNVERARTHGLEASADWRPGPRLSLRASLGLLATRIVEAADVFEPLEGRQFQRSPGLTASGSLSWRPIDRFDLSLSGRHHSAYFSDDRNSPALRIDPATMIDTSATLDLGRARLFGYARNLLDEFALTYLFSPTFGTAADPREIGLGLELRF